MAAQRAVRGKRGAQVWVGVGWGCSAWRQRGVRSGVRRTGAGRRRRGHRIMGPFRKASMSLAHAAQRGRQRRRQWRGVVVVEMGVKKAGRAWAVCGAAQQTRVQEGRMGKTALCTRHQTFVRKPNKRGNAVIRGIAKVAAHNRREPEPALVQQRGCCERGEGGRWKRGSAGVGNVGSQAWCVAVPRVQQTARTQGNRRSVGCMRSRRVRMSNNGNRRPAGGR